ncbi:serpin-ZXA-like [Arachis stenosperma]|uniref:serpin-ZXA-like n=1 Tax=Arachis stenosperma TaxID=217475 RepID=UPI0025AB8642|nr:serpin-ZXA-like [Arachis stenosperma]
MTRKRKTLSNSATNTTTTNDGEKAAAPVITPEFRLAKHLLLSKESGGYKNVAFSSLCIMLLLGIVAAGSKGPDVIMANTLYFKGLWRNIGTFREKDTRDGDFHLLDGGGSVKVPFMDGSHHHYAIAHHYQDFKVLSLNYMEASENVPKRVYTMHIFLPDEINGLPALVQKVCTESESLENMFPNGWKKLGVLKILRFRLSFMVEASPMLKKMGLVLPFMKGALTELVEERVAYISDIIQKCIIEVNEEGTKAVAAVRCQIPTTAGRTTKKPPPPFDFIANHPFLFLIREQYTGTVLFVGQVLNPLYG